MKISLIVAMDENGLIGDNGKLPWKLPADMKFFKKITMGKPVIMGRKTFESIGKPLAGRFNIILTRDKNYKVDGCFVVHSVGEALEIADNAAQGIDVNEVMIIGGVSIYKEFLPLAHEMRITLVHHVFLGDTFFPGFDKKEWKEIIRYEYYKDEDNPYDMTMSVFERGEKQGSG